MVSDATIGLGYVIQNVGSYGGDPDRLVCNTNHTFVIGSQQIVHLVHTIYDPSAS